MALYHLETSEPNVGVNVAGSAGRLQPCRPSQGLHFAIGKFGLPPSSTTPEAPPKHQEPARDVVAPPGVLEQQVTTLLLRNVPRGYTEEALALELEAQTGPRSFDFIYLPWDNSRHSNNGHAFVNLVNPSLARALAEQFDGQPWRFTRSHKMVGVRVANMQGISANLAHYVESLAARCSQPSQPWILQNGSRMSLLDALAAFCSPSVTDAYVQASMVKSGSAPAHSVVAPFKVPRSKVPASVQHKTPPLADHSSRPTPHKASLCGRTGLLPVEWKKAAQREPRHETRCAQDGIGTPIRQLTVQCLDDFFVDPRSAASHDVSMRAKMTPMPNTTSSCSETSRICSFRFSV